MLTEFFREVASPIIGVWCPWELTKYSELRPRAKRLEVGCGVKVAALVIVENFCWLIGIKSRPGCKVKRRDSNALEPTGKRSMNLRERIRNSYDFSLSPGVRVPIFSATGVKVW